MTPSNPATFFVTGSDQKEFTYPHGHTPYYAIMRSKSHIPLCLMVFADSEAHVRLILHDLVDFATHCLDKRRTDRVARGNNDKHGLDERSANAIDVLRKVLEGRTLDYKLHIGKAATNQLYKIGWASNDDIL